VVVPVVIFVVCVSVGVLASSRWLPALATGTLGGIVFFVVCGMLGAALGLVGLHIYSIVREAEAFGGASRAAFVAGGLDALLWETGSLVGLATVVYLLAPRALAADDAPGPGI
jgi:hypothetical protein